MQAYCKIDESGRITAISTNFHCGDGEITVEVPDTVDLRAENQVLSVVDGVVVALPLTEDTQAVDEITLLRAQVASLCERNEFVEDCMAEMAMKVYQ